MRSIRRLMIAALLCAGGLAGTTITPAAADRFGGADAAGDVSSVNADIVGHHARYAGDRLDVWIRTADRPDRSRQSTDVSYVVEASIDGDDEADAAAAVEWDFDRAGWFATTYLPDSEEACSSSQVPTPLANDVVRVPIVVSCWGSPESIRYGVDVFQYTGFYNPPIVDFAPDDILSDHVARSRATGEGYWLLGRDGGVFSFGDARFFGSTGNMRLNQPVVGMSAHPSGEGYWFVAGDGGVFTFGSAGFHGSTGDIRLNQPIVGMASTPSGRGYWLVASDGGIFTFGDAKFFGSAGSIRLAQPIVGMAPSPTGQGYWLVAKDGGIFTFGDARFRGSIAGKTNGRPVVAMAPTQSGDGYWIIDESGLVIALGDAKGVFSLTRFGAIPAISGLTAGPNGGARAVGVDGRVYEMADTHHGDVRGMPLSAQIIDIATTA